MAVAPHFVCIGAQKAGTQWLYDQAESHPHIWMPPIKEVRYFHGKWENARAVALRRLSALMRQRWRGEPVDSRDLEFLRRMCLTSAHAGVSNMETYRDMFEVAGDALTGDVTPAYARLTRPEVETIVDGLPDTRFLYLVREPVSRVWSAACMSVYWENSGPEVVTDVAALAEFLDRRSVRELSFQSRTIDLWSECAGDRFAVFRMSEMISAPTEFRRRVFGYLGLDGDLCAIAGDHNKKSGRPKPVLTDELRQVIVDFLGDECERLEQRLALEDAADRSVGVVR